MNRNHPDPDGGTNRRSHGRSNVEGIPGQARAPRGVEQADDERDDLNPDDDGLDSDGKTGPPASRDSGAGARNPGR